jgi:hypothetical protein
MSKKKLLALTISSVAPKLMAVAALPLVISLVSPAEYANYAAILSLSTIALPLLVWGSDNFVANISFEELPAYTQRVFWHLFLTSVGLFSLALILGKSGAAWAVVIASSMGAMSIFHANVVRKSRTLCIIVVIALPSLALEIWRVLVVFMELAANPLLFAHSSYALAVLVVSLLITWQAPAVEYRLPKAYWSFAFARTSSQLLNNLSIQALPLAVYQTFDKSLAGILFASLALLSTPYSVLGKKQVYMFNDEMKKKFSAHWAFLAANISIFVSFVALMLSVPQQIIPTEWRDFKAFILPISVYAGTIFIVNPYLQIPAISGKHRNLFLFPIIRLATLICSIIIIRISELGLNEFLWIYSICVAVFAIIVAAVNVKTIDL